MRRQPAHFAFDPLFGLGRDFFGGFARRVDGRADADGDQPRFLDEGVFRPEFAGIVCHRHRRNARGNGEQGAAGLEAAANELLVAIGQGVDDLVGQRPVRGVADARVVVHGLDQTDADALANSLQSPADLLLIETPSNPLLRVVDLETTVAMARDAGVLTLADNTFCSPVRQRPIEFGCELVVHSTTKFINGHPTRIWVMPKGKRNEALDCRVYARAAAWIAGADRWSEEKWRDLEDQLGAAPYGDTDPAGQINRPGQAPQGKRRSDWLGRREGWF